VAVAVVPLLLAACGGASKSSSSGSFVLSADAACVTRATTVGSVYETTGERHKAFTGAWAAGVAGGQAMAQSQELTVLKGLKPPSGQGATHSKLLSTLQQMAGVLRQEQSAATKGDAAGFKALDSTYSNLNNTADRLAAQLGLSACAGNGLSSSDKSQISHVVSSTVVTNSTSHCTQNVTLAFIRQVWGTMANCVRNGKRPVGRNNPRSVDVSHYKGAGDFATADVVFHFAGGRRQKLAVGAYRQNGSWRLLGFSNA
jgi:hypothetical protein